MKLKWFTFVPAKDGFDILVYDQGADNGVILAECGVRGKTFEQFVDEVLTEGLDKINPPEAEEPLPASTDKDWGDEPPVIPAFQKIDPELFEKAEPEGVPDETPPSEDSTSGDSPDVVGVSQTNEKKGWLK